MDLGRAHHENNEQRDAFTTAHWNGRDLALTVFPAPPGRPSVGELARALIGRDVQPAEWAELVGAPDGSTLRVATARVDLDGMRESVQILLDHPWLEGTAVRYVYRDDGSRLAMFNDFVFFRPGSPPGVGTRLLVLQVRKAISLGIEHIATDAAGGPGSTFVGYSVWPRLGFDGPIPPAARAKVDALPEDHPLRTAQTVRDLMARPGGRAWWQANGSEFRAYFDLAEGSVSRRLLAAYTREKGIIV